MKSILNHVKPYRSSTRRLRESHERKEGNGGDSKGFGAKGVALAAVACDLQQNWEMTGEV